MTDYELAKKLAYAMGWGNEYDRGIINTIVAALRLSRLVAKRENGALLDAAFVHNVVAEIEDEYILGL